MHKVRVKWKMLFQFGLTVIIVIGIFLYYSIKMNDIKSKSVSETNFDDVVMDNLVESSEEDSEDIVPAKETFKIKDVDLRDKSKQSSMKAQVHDDRITNVREMAKKADDGIVAGIDPDIKQKNDLLKTKTNLKKPNISSKGDHFGINKTSQ